MMSTGHIAWHASAGFVWMLLENPAAIQKNMAIPDVVAQTCPNWDKWSAVDRVRKCALAPLNIFDENEADLVPISSSNRQRNSDLKGWSQSQVSQMLY